MFQTQIAGSLLISDYVKERYFEMIRGFYLANRQRYTYLLNPLAQGLGDCSTCSAVRMTLVPPPVFPDAQNTNPAAADMIANYSNFLQGGLGNLQALSDSAYTVYNNYNSALCVGPVDLIIAQLVNCADSINLVGVKNSLLSLCNNNLVANGNYTPEQIRWAIINNGISMNDLCNPYLVNYDNNMTLPPQEPGLFGCSNDDFYSDATATLNNGTVLGRLKNTGSSASYTLNASNDFEQGLITALGGTSATVSATYNATQHLYTLSFVNGSNIAKIFFKTAASGTCSTAFTENPGETVSVAVSCINESSFSAWAKGEIGKYTFVATVSHTSGSGVTQCILPSWTNKIQMNFAGNNPIARCIPCTQMRDLYRVFTDTLMAYDVKGVDHPYYNTMLRNFMNHKLKKAYTLDQYENFIESCALADSVQIMRYIGYLNATFTNGAYAQNFLNALNALDPTINILVNYRLRTIYGEQIAIDLNGVPKNKLRTVVNFFNNYTAGTIQKLTNVIDNATDFRGYLWLPDTTSFNPATAIPGLNFTQNPASIEYWNGVAFEPYKQMLAYAPPGSTLANANYNVALLRNYLYEHAIVSNFYPCIQTTVNNEYALPEKQDYLHYTYNYQNQSPNKVLDSLQVPYLEAGISLFNGQMMSYGHPAEPGNINNLYYADASTATSGTLYSKLTYIINQVKSELGSNELFFDGSNTRNIPVPSGQLLTAYRCGDTAFWYRYFGPGDTLYNVFIRVPAYFDIAAISNYQWQNTTFNLGDEASRSFKVSLQNPAAPYQTITLNGYTDFTVARNKVLKNVLLAHGINDSPPLADTVNNCERQRLKAAIYEGKIKYKLYMDSIRARLISDFYAYILNDATQEKLYIGYHNQRFNYTLYYYDRAGNLMRTVPPAGVSYVANSLLNGVNTERAGNSANPTYLPGHHKESDYHYNTLNQVVEQETPDGGRTEYFYDAAGRVIFSQNAKQRQVGDMTYTLYDKQGRIVETGQAKLACTPYFTPYNSPTGLGTPTCSYYVAGQITPFVPVVHDLKNYSHEDVSAYVRSLSREEVVLTHYDTAAVNLPLAGQGMSPQENLRKRVSCIKYFDYLQPSDTLLKGYNYAMHFSYDIAGNVKTLTRDYPSWKIHRQQFKRVDYDYDVISGKVNLLSYNRSFADQYFQRYSYDGDNRITKVETSADGYIWKRDAAYQYYQHGPLARMSLGDLRVQGVDYAYTIQGWLKAVNGDLLDTTKDMGGDATANSVHAKDAVALSLDYFKGDYRPIGNTAVTHIADPSRNMYNGNIPRATTAIAPFPTLNTNYVYDQLNRIIKAQYAYVNPYDASLSNTADYYSKYAYDPDGNLQKLVRNGNAVGGSSQLMDSMQYHYQPGAYNNRLQNVTDYVANTFHNDIKQYTNTGASRYLYDATGNTIKDQVSGQDTIIWNHYNKVMLTRRDSLGNNLDFAYDGAGNRYLKTVVREDADTTLERSDYYVRDAQGNILAVYDAESRYQMTKEEWIEYITTQLVAEIGVHPFVEHIAQYYAQEGHFKSSVLTAALSDAIFTDAMVNSLPVSFYVEHSPVIKYNLSYPSIPNGYDSFYNAMRVYYDNTQEPILGSGLYNFFQLDATGSSGQVFFDNLLGANIDDEVRLHVLELLCQHADSATRSMMGRFFLTYYSGNCHPNAEQILELVNSDSETAQEITGNIAQLLVMYPGDYYAFAKALSLDPIVLNYGGYTDANQGGALISTFQFVLSQYTNASVLGSFLDTWQPAGDWLKRTVPASYLLPVVYDNAPAALIEAYINHQSGSLAVVNNGLNLIPWLTPTHLLDHWNPVVVVDTIIHTIYKNVLHSRRISLSEHHLYGSSRLGTKEYLPGEYYQSWDYSTTPATADTATLATRRAWYSMEYNDAISGLALQPWSMTDMSAYLAGHTLGQKQYELTNHLGNVQATLSDYPAYHPVGYGDTIREHNPALVTAYDYYPFGMLMPGRGTDSLSAIGNVINNILLIYNDFNDNTTQSWAPYNGVVSVTNENNQLKAVAGSIYQGIIKGATVIQGRQYRVRFDVPIATVGIAISEQSGGWRQVQYNTLTGAQDFTFTAYGPQAIFLIETNTVGGVFAIDNFILEEVKQQPEVPPVVSDGCITMTQSKWVTVWETICKDPPTWPNATLIGNGTISNTGGAIEITAPNSIDGVSFNQEVMPGVWQTLNLSVSRIISGSGYIQVLEEQNGVLQSIGMQSFNHAGEIKVNFKPQTSYITWQVLGPVQTQVTQLCFDRPVLKQENVLVTICPEDKDKYRFGFNGQEKVNEWAGIGNFLEFSERGYDSRIGRFLRVDPIASDFPMQTPYQFAFNNPIWMIEYEGLEGVPTSVTNLDYGKILDSYPSDGQKLLRKVGSSLNWLAPGTNTCAIKMSEAFNLAGYKIPTAKQAPKGVRVQTGNKKVDKSNNYILDAKSFGKFLNSIQKPTYKFENLNTDEAINKALDEIHKSDDLKGIMVLSAGNEDAYRATGHVDFVYEDFMWDVSIESYGGKDLDSYLKENKEANFKLEIWVLEED